MPWDSVKAKKKTWVLKKGSEQVRFTRSSTDNSSLTVQKDQERPLTLQAFQARDTFRKLIDYGYKLK